MAAGELLFTQRFSPCPSAGGSGPQQPRETLPAQIPTGGTPIQAGPLAACSSSPDLVQRQAPGLGEEQKSLSWGSSISAREQLKTKLKQYFSLLLFLNPPPLFPTLPEMPAVCWGLLLFPTHRGGPRVQELVLREISASSATSANPGPGHSWTR